VDKKFLQTLAKMALILSIITSTLISPNLKSESAQDAQRINYQTNYKNSPQDQNYWHQKMHGQELRQHEGFNDRYATPPTNIPEPEVVIPAPEPAPSAPKCSQCPKTHASCLHICDTIDSGQHHPICIKECSDNARECSNNCRSDN